MSVFVSSETIPILHGVYAIERQPPSVISATGTGTACIVEQFPWGPSQKLTQPASNGDLLNTIAPPGMSRTGSGYLSVIKRGWPLLKFVRVLGSTAAPATVTLASTTPTNIITVTLKYSGTGGNACTATVSPASDGDVNHFNLTVSVTGASGTTNDIFQNLNYSGVGADSAPDLTSTLLVGSITKLASGIPATGTTSFATATDGTITSADYVGTQGVGDKGVALLEGDKKMDAFFCGDPGNTLRAAVNAGFMAHADYMTDRVAYLNGNSGQALSAVATDVANYRSIRCVYVDSWAYINRDVDGVTVLVPPASFAASVACQLSPSTSIAWKADGVKSMLNAIVDLEFDRGTGAGTNTQNGVVTLVREPDGGYAFEAGVVTAAPSSPAKKNLTRTRMGHYIARSMVSSLRPSVDAPNVQLNQQDIVDAVDGFMSTLKNNAKLDPNNKPFVVDYTIPDLKAFNPQSQIDAGMFEVPLNAKLGSAMEKIFLSFQFGETVKVTGS